MQSSQPVPAAMVTVNIVAIPTFPCHVVPTDSVRRTLDSVDEGVCTISSSETQRPECRGGGVGRGKCHWRPSVQLPLEGWWEACLQCLGCTIMGSSGTGLWGMRT